MALILIGTGLAMLSANPASPLSQHEGRTDLDIAGGGAGTVIGPRVAHHETPPLRWGLRSLDAPTAWQTTRGSRNTVVAVIDSGIDRTHPALAGRLWQNPNEIAGNGVDDDGNGYVDDIHGWDFRDADNDALSGSPFHPHGTFVAGLIAATVDATGVGGVAPDVRLMDLRFLDARNAFRQGDWPRFTAAVDYAVGNGADVINLSVTARDEPPPAFRQALRRAVDEGIVIVGAVGNRTSHVSYPAKYPEVIAVTAIDAGDRIAYFSNAGPEVELAAPGSRVTSLHPDKGVQSGSGTSFAAAHVSGAVALLHSLNPQLSVVGARRLLHRGARDLGEAGRDERFGFGVADAAAAVRSLR